MPRSANRLGMKRSEGRQQNSFAWIQFACCACWVISFCGCRSVVPIYVWQPASFICPHNARIAIAPIAGNAEVAARIERALVMQQPVARGDLKLISAQDLIAYSPIRLVSTAAMENEATAIQAAQQSAAELLLEGEVLSAKLVDPQNREPLTEESPPPNEQLLISWRVIDVTTSKSVANQVVSIDTLRADSDYPDMLLTHPDPTDRLIIASARDSWKGLAPSVAKDEVELMVPWLQVGAMSVRTGIVDAQNGRWDLASQKFDTAARWNPLNVAAHHNLAIAQAAREDFRVAKSQLSRVSWPLSTRLPAESRIWLDQRDRQFQAAHGLGEPAEGWLFPDPVQRNSSKAVKPTRIEELPWWTAIPMAKPPGWTWRAWFTQPWVL